jgi:hypothetical protein
MVFPLRVASWRRQVLLAKSIAVWRATSSKVEEAPTGAEAAVQAEADALQASKSIDQLF